MMARTAPFGQLHRKPLPAARGWAVGLAVVLVAIDWATWVEFNEALVYPLALVLAAMARSRRLVWSLALFLVAMTFAVYAAQVGPGVFSLLEPDFVNRGLAAVTILVTACVLHAWTLALDRLDEQGRDLAAQNERLDAANLELRHCNEEIARQNEELDRRRRCAEETSGRKTRLLASVSHDMRSPLNVISLTAEVLRRTAADPALPGRVPGLAQRLQANSAALADLVSDLIDMSAIEFGRVELRESEFLLSELLADECSRMLPVAQVKGLTLEAEPVIPPVRLRADRARLARVLGNLVTNAVKFTDTGGVKLTADLTPDEAVAIRVHDTGVGIPAEDLESIFDEFAQLHHTGHDCAKGWGLGLAICRQTISAMGGTIGVESAPSVGSVFTVRLPLHGATSTSKVDSATTPMRLVK